MTYIRFTCNAITGDASRLDVADVPHEPLIPAGYAGRLVQAGPAWVGDANGDGPCTATPAWQLVMRLAGERLAAAAVESELVKVALIASADCAMPSDAAGIHAPQSHDAECIMDSDEAAVVLYIHRMRARTPAAMPASGVKPAPHGICTTADGDHRLGRFKA